MLGTLLGAGLGAVIGAATGNVGAGAAIGGATGLVGGTAMGSDAGYASQYQLQRRYDIAYQQCMYAGNRYPVRQRIDTMRRLHRLHRAISRRRRLPHQTLTHPRRQILNSLFVVQRYRRDARANDERQGILPLGCNPGSLAGRSAGARFPGGKFL
ncbi:MAG: YMGG-like glycine zipper-containing protein [Syntrophorhabdales bacterium]